MEDIIELHHLDKICITLSTQSIVNKGTVIVCANYGAVAVIFKRKDLVLPKFFDSLLVEWELERQYIFLNRAELPQEILSCLDTYLGWFLSIEEIKESTAFIKKSNGKQVFHYFVEESTDIIVPKITTNYGGYY